jgi:hypothetical protein
MAKNFLAYVGYNMDYYKDYKPIGISRLLERAQAVALKKAEENGDEVDPVALETDRQAWTEDHDRVYGVVEIIDLDSEVFKEED